MSLIDYAKEHDEKPPWADEPQMLLKILVTGEPGGKYPAVIHATGKRTLVITRNITVSVPYWAYRALKDREYPLADVQIDDAPAPNTPPA